jgi:phytoene desaturase
MKSSGNRAIVVGAGIGGLATASSLAHSGWDVTVLEKNSQVGGRARLWETDGFRFDMGPSWYLMPEVFERFFESVGKKREDYYGLHRLDPYYRVYFGPEESVEITSDLERNAALFESFETGGGQRLKDYLKQAEYKYDIAMREFLYRDYSSIFDFFNRRIIFEGLRMNVLSGLDRFVSRYFRDRRARQILEYAMVFLGTSPKAAPAMYSIMSHVDLNLGVFYPDGGLSGVAEAMRRLAEDLGVEIRTEAEVRSINVDRGVVRSLETDSEAYEGDAVVMNADYAHVETQLLEERFRSLSPRYWRNRVLAPSMFILYLGLNRKLESLQHHNLYFSADWYRHFDTIFERPRWPENPCFYVSCISKTDSHSAPAGCENVFVLVPVAPGMDDSQEVRERYAEDVIRHLESITGERIGDSIAVKRIYSHRDFIKDYNAYGGTALGLAHTLGQTAVFRPSHRSRKVKNLFYTGHYTHPGVGVPMVLISSKVVTDIINGEHS